MCLAKCAPTDSAPTSAKCSSTVTELILARNTSGSTARRITVRTPRGQQQYSIPSGAYVCLGPLYNLGWQQPDGNVWIDVETTEVQIAVLVMPT